MTGKLRESPPRSQEQSESTMGTRLRNLPIVLVATALSVALFWDCGLRLPVSLNILDEQSTPLRWFGQWQADADRVLCQLV